MNKTAFLILLVLLLGGAGAIFAWPGNDLSDIALSEPEEWLGDNTEAAHAGLKLVAAGDEEPEEADDLPEGLEAISREEITDEGQKLRYLVVQVWDRRKGVPAAQADVFFLDGFDGPELRDPYAQHWSDLAESKGRKFKTDAEGRVQLPPVQRWAIVTAQRPGSYGFARVGRRHRKVETIMLQPDETVTVRVVAAAGSGHSRGSGDGERPVAGVPVGVVQRVPVRRQARNWQELMAQMKMLDQAARDVEAYMRANPRQRAEVAPKINQIRERQKRLKGAMGQLKGKGKGKKGKKGQRARQPKPTITARPELRARRRTNEEGIAVFRHFQVYRHQNAKWWPKRHIDRFEAVLLMPLQQPESRAFSGRPVPTETIELRLPPTGSIALRTVDIDGRPFTHPVHADLRMKGENPVPWARVQHRKEQNQTEIVFPFVGLGLQFTAHCRLDDNDFRWVLPLFAGPISAGERVTVDMVVAPRSGMLFGRLLDKAGQPLAGARPTFLINSSAGRLEGEDVTLDKDGRFHLAFQVRNNQRAPFRLEIRQRNVRPVAGLAMPLPRLPAGRVTDLGDLRIDDFGKVAHGTVVDDRGQPIRGATVQLQRERDTGGKQPRLRFVDEAFAVGRTDEKGHYEVFGELEHGRYRLRAQARNHFPFESQDLRQSKLVDLKLQRNSKVVGTVLTPAGLKSRNLRVVLESAVDPKQRREDRIHDHKGKKYIYFDWVRPGIYNVVIRVQDFPDPVLRVDSLQIAAGQQGVHRRLKDLNLAALISRFEVKAVDQEGRPIKPSGPLLAQIVRPGGRTGFVGFPWRGNKIEILSASTQLEVWPMAAGYRAQNTVLSPGSNELRFLKIPPVILNMPGLSKMVGTTPAWVTMRLVGDSGLPDRLESWDGRSGKIAGWYNRARRVAYARLKNDTVQLSMLRDGRYKVMMVMGKKSKDSRMARVELGVVDARVEPGAGPLQLTVRYDAKKVEAGLAQLAPR